MKRQLFVLVTLACVVGAGFVHSAHAGTIFKRGANWNYYKGNDHPSGGDWVD